MLSLTRVDVFSQTAQLVSARVRPTIVARALVG